MRTLRIVFCVCACMILLSGSMAWGGGLEKISDNVYAYTHIKSGAEGNRFGANAGIVVGLDGVLVVDTLGSAKEAAGFLADIRKITPKPIRYVVNTHYHLDHAFGNCVFSDQGADIIGHAKCRSQVLKTRGEALETARSLGMDDAALEGTRIVVPDVVFEQSMALDMGNCVVRLIHGGRASHTEGSIYVWIPDRKIVFAGDILFTDFHPYMAEGNLKGWAQTLDDLLALGAEKIIPGHGPVSGVKDIKEMKSYLATFDQKARKLCAGSDDLEKITGEMIKILPERPYGQFIVQANIQMRYLQKKNAE